MMGALVIPMLVIAQAGSMTAPAVGALNPLVTQESIDTTICVKGWTAKIRPAESYTYNLKRRQMKTLGLKGRSSSYEEDHLISLELGGSPTDPRNLWPQPWKGKYNAHKKDMVEDELHARVCKGAISLQAAQQIIVTDWYSEYLRYIKTKR